MKKTDSNRHLIFVSGLSGAGKSVALHTLEDLNYYCIDNLPISLMDNLIDELDPLPENIAIGINARNVQRDPDSIAACMQALRDRGILVELLFLDAGDDVLTKRFSETRRKHPLSSDQVPLYEAISAERQILSSLADIADLRLDTSHTSVHELRRLIRERVTQHSRATLSIQLVSFGYKYGTPPDADFVFDARCLPNPYWDNTLRSFSGQDQPVIDFLNDQTKAHRMQEDLCGFLERWMPEFETENRSYLTIAIGCTGGRHRSVYLVDRIAERLRGADRQVIVRHRDL